MLIGRGSFVNQRCAVSNLSAFFYTGLLGLPRAGDGQKAFGYSAEAFEIRCLCRVPN